MSHRPEEEDAPQPAGPAAGATPGAEVAPAPEPRAVPEAGMPPVAPGSASEAAAPAETPPGSEAELPPESDTAPAPEAAAQTEPPPAPDADAPPDPALIAEGVRIAEALIFASDRPVTPAMLAAALPEGLTATQVVPVLAGACEGRGVTLMEVAGGWAFRTAPDLAMRLTKVVQAPRRLPRAAMEALSIVAYHQPCTRGEIEEIRGAALAQTTLEALLELGLIAPRGRREVPGRPTLWGTTPRFLEQFGLKSLTDLPRKEELVTAETGPALPLPGMAPQAELDLPPTEETLPEEPGEARPSEAEETPDEPGPPAPGA